MTDSLTEIIGTGRSSGTRIVTREMVHALAAQMVLRDGRVSSEATMSDLAQAKRELTGEALPGSVSTRS